MNEQRIVIQWPNGAEGAVLESAFGDKDLAENFKGARATGFYEDGSEYSGPTTPEGMARKAEREAEERTEARAKTRPERREAWEEPAAKADEPAVRPAEEKE